MRQVVIPDIVEAMMANPFNKQVFLSFPTLPGWISNGNFAAHVGKIPAGFRPATQEQSEALSKIIGLPQVEFEPPHPKVTEEAHKVDRLMLKAIDGRWSILDLRLVELFDGLNVRRLGDGFGAPVAGVDGDGDVVVIVMPLNEDVKEFLVSKRGAA